MHRKSFLQLVLAGAATGSLAALAEACSNSNQASNAPTVNFTLDLSQSANSSLNTSGGSLVSNNVIVINNNGTILAFSDLCTHQGCSVNYDKTGKQLLCPCHGGTYSLSGAVTGGPPPSPLKSYSVTRNGNILTIKG